MATGDSMAPDAGIQVMIVDDQETDATVLRDALLKQGYDVEVYDDSVEAYEKLTYEDEDTGEVPKYDLLVFDVNMPKLDGLTLTKRLRKHGIHTPVLFVTGGVPNGVSLAIKGLGPSVDILQKDSDDSILLGKCAELLSRGQISVQVGELSNKFDQFLELFQKAPPLDAPAVGDILEEKLSQHCPMVHEDLLSEANAHADTLVDEGTEPAKLVEKAKKNPFIKWMVGLVTIIVTGAGGMVVVSHSLATNASQGVKQVQQDIKQVQSSVEPLKKIPEQMTAQQRSFKVEIRALRDTIFVLNRRDPLTGRKLRSVDLGRIRSGGPRRLTTSSTLYKPGLSRYMVGGGAGAIPTSTRVTSPIR